MPDNFSSVNAAQGGAVPQFQQVPTVQGDTGEGVLSTANLATSLFQQATQFQAGKANTEAQTSVGMLQDKLTRIRQAGATDNSVDVVGQQRRALTEFNAQHPQLSGEATKAFKTATGTSPGGLSVEERAELDSRNAAINAGWGRFGADDEYNQEQYEAYTTLKEQDRLLTSQTKRDAAAIQARTLHKSVQKDRILAGANQMFQTYTGKTESDMKDLRARWSSGEVGTEQAMLEIREARIKINKELTSLGEFGTDPVINIYSQPTLDSLQLAEDVITGKIELDAVNAITTRNTTMAKSKFLADPEMLALYTATEMFPNVTGTDSKITSKVLKALNGGIIKQSDLRTGAGSNKAKPVDVSGLDDGEQSVFMDTMENMFKGGVTENTDKAIAQAANTMAGVTKFFQRNYEDLDPEDSKFIVKALAIPGAMESMSKEQQVIAMDAMNTHIITVVDVAVRENITQSTLTAISPRDNPSVRQLAQTGETRPTSEVADLIVEGGITAWKVKPEFLSQPRVRAQVQQINKNIREDITPSVDVMSLGLKISPEQYQATLFAIDEVGKPEVGGDVSVNASFSRKEDRGEEVKK